MIELRSIRKSLGGRPVLGDLSLKVEKGETMVLLGESGCGKTTTLRLVNRLLRPDSGQVLVGGADIAAQDPVLLRRSMGYMIQSIGLFPHWSVGQNILTLPCLLGWDSRRRHLRLERLMQMVSLPVELASRHPAELSGGQRQRVGLARALAADPPVLLMDEPFGALDPLTRTQIRAELGGLVRRLGKTLLLVTHDVSEAIELGDRIALLRGGRVEQVDRPLGLLRRPATGYAREFFDGGRMLLEWRAIRVANESERLMPILPERARQMFPPDATAADVAEWIAREAPEVLPSWVARCSLILGQYGPGQPPTALEVER